MKKVVIRMAAIAAAWAWFSTASQAAVAAKEGQCRVWTESATVRLLGDAPAEAGSPVRLEAARNESVSFQVFIRSEKPVQISDFVLAGLIGPSGRTIDEGCVRLYREHQFEITQPTIRNDEFRAGWYPDALIPVRNPITGEKLSGARFQALPWTLPARETHGFWIDIVVPPEAVPGVYRAQWPLAGPEGRIAAIPVELTVWPFTLPKTPSFATALGAPAAKLKSYLAEKQSVSDWAAVETQCNQLLMEHRINATPSAEWLSPDVAPDGSFRLSDEALGALRDFVDRFGVNAVRLPHPRTVAKDPQDDRARLQRWLGSWDEAIDRIDRPAVVFYFYLKDEPNDEEAYRYVQQWGRAIKSAKTKAKVLVVEQTKTQDPSWGDLYGAVDIWCSLFPLFDPTTAAARQTRGEINWVYTALCQRDKTPWWQTDYPLLNYRVPAWTAWRYGSTGILYWGDSAFWSDVEDPWTEPWTLDRRDRRPDMVYNGEGSLLYPAVDAGYAGLAPSMRLKALRDGIEDYEYLAMLQRAGKADQAQSIVNRLTPSWFKWNTNPAAYDEARRELAHLLASQAP